MRWSDISRKIELLDNLLQRFERSIRQIVEQYPDSDLYLKILGLNEWTSEDFESLIRKIHGTRHHRNHRDERTYVANLLLGWIVQDFVETLLTQKGYKCRKTGGDAQRELLQGKQISEEPDIQIIVPSGQVWKMDIVADYPTQRGAASFWEEKKRCHLRDSKFQRLVKERENGYRAGLIGVSVGTSKYFGLELTSNLLEQLNNPPARGRLINRRETHWAYGGKPAIELNLRLLGVQFRDLSEFPEGLPFTQQGTR